jgi:membrane-associated phospholipid phosphatase
VNGVRSLRDDGRLLAQLFVATGRQLARRRPPWSWAVAWGLTFAVTLTYVWKRPIAALVEGHGGWLAARLAGVANVAGAGISVTVAGLVLLVVGRGLRRDSLVECALVLGAAGAWGWLLTQAGQLVLAERRPLEGGAMRWFDLGGHGVSGHAAAAALLLAPVRDVLARGASREVRAAISGALLVWAAFIAWSRMWLGMHYLWNVALGLALGFLAGRAAVVAWREVVSRSSP